MPLSESKSKKGKSKNPRSQFLSALMKTLGGDTGDALAQAFVSGDSERFNKKFAAVGKKLAAKMETGKSESSACDDAVHNMSQVMTYARNIAPMCGLKLVEHVTLPRAFNRERRMLRLEATSKEPLNVSMSRFSRELSAFASCCSVSVVADSPNVNVVRLRSKLPKTKTSE